MSVSADNRVALSENPGPTPSLRGAERLGRRASRLKLELSTRLSAKRAALSLVQRDVHDRPRLVSDWEDPHKPHSPTLMHLVEQVSDPVSRPYAMEAIAWVLEKAEREESRNPAQLSLLDLIANTR